MGDESAAAEELLADRYAGLVLEDDQRQVEGVDRPRLIVAASHHRLQDFREREARHEAVGPGLQFESAVESAETGQDRHVATQVLLQGRDPRRRRHGLLLDARDRRVLGDQFEN